MPDFQTFIAIVTTLLVFLTGVALKYDTIYFRNYHLTIPQWAGLSFAGITFTFVVLDQLLRGFVRLEEIQRRTEEKQRRSEDRSRAVAREAKQDREREEDLARAENDRTEERNQRAEAREREARRTRIENQYRLALIRFQLDPNPTHRRQLANILSLLEEYGDTL